MPHPSAPATGHDPLTLAATTWLAGGIVLLGLTPLPLHDPTLGWSPVFWLLAAPAILLLARRFFPLSQSKRLAWEIGQRPPSMAARSVAFPEPTGSPRLRSHRRQATRRPGATATITPRRHSASLPCASATRA